MTEPTERSGVDEVLACGRRGLRSAPGRLLLGPTGARLWADVLDEQPGFVGVLDMVHKLNIPLLYTTRVEPSPIPGPPATVEWRPSHLTMTRRFGAAVLTERKFISWDDVAVSEQRWTNSGSDPLTLTLGVDPDWCGPMHDGVSIGRRWIENRDFAVLAVVTANEPRLWSGLVLSPGESRTVIVAAALGLAESDSVDDLSNRARHATVADVVERQRADYQTWFDATPSFTSSDPVLDRLWTYRWFLLRHNLAEPRAGALTTPVVYEGRSHKMTKAPWNPQGWEFSKHIPLSTPMHVIELRWHHDAEIAASAIRSVIDRQGADGQLYSATANETMHPYANFMGWAAWQYAQLHGCAAITEALSTLKRQVRGERKNLAPDDDELPVQVDHRLTGKEYQPSYWYFAGYPDDPKNPRGYTPLKRVDRAIYHYLNARGVAGLCRMTADPDRREFEELAERVAGSVLAKQWDPDGEYFYDLHHETDQRALVRNIVGFYPWWAGITSERHRTGFEKAFTADRFGSPWPMPSVEVNCPVYQPAGSWKGAYLKGRNGCMWDGPTWPYTNSVVLDAIGRESRRAGHQFDALFADVLRRYALLHFTQHDGATPYLVEHYDSQTGEPISDEPDYNHSYLIDLIIRHVAGLSMEVEGTDGRISIEVDPIEIGLDHFQLEDVRVAGHVVAIRYSRASGLSVSIDGVERAARPNLGYLAFQLPRTRRPADG